MRKSIKVTFFIFISLCLALVLATAIGLIIITNKDSYVDLDIDKLPRSIGSLQIYDANGKSIYSNNDRYIKLTDLQQHTIDAFVSVEDKRFFRHKGIDSISVVRAIVRNIKSGRIIEGGSTITQQLIKNTHLTSERTSSRKINEMLLAMQLEKQLSKEEILQTYLNTVYFGDNCYGLQSASNYYFNKNAEELTLIESATLAGMLKAPNNYSPTKSIERSTNRRNIALLTMKNNGYINETEYIQAKNSRMTITKTTRANTTYINNVLTQASDILGIDKASILKGNYIIETYFDTNTSDNLTQAMLEDNTCNLDKSQTDKLGIVVDNRTNGIIAIYGNTDITDDIDSIKRQAGSLLKPLAVYTPALERNQITVATPILDEPTSYGNYCPRNYNNNYQGWTTVSQAVSKSLNIPAIKVLNMIGSNTARNYLQQLNIPTTDDDNNLTLALGCITNGVTPRKILDGYTTLANGGEYKNSSFIKSIKLNGKKIYEHSSPRKRVFDKINAYLMTYMLEDVAKNGTGRQLKDLDISVAVKTGTYGNNNNTDLYMCGYTTEQTFLIWLGGNMDNKNTGGVVCGKIAKKYLKKEYENTSSAEFSRPNGIVFKKIDVDYLEQRHIVRTSAKKGIYMPFSVANCPK